MATAKEYSPEELNFFRICDVVTRIIAQSLRKVFKHEWNSRYKGICDEWEDTAQNGIDFHSKESSKSRKNNSSSIDTWKIGNTLEWDCTCLSSAILYSDSIGNDLHPDVKEGVDDLRKFRNEFFAHLPSGKLTEAAFQTSIAKVIAAFGTLNLDTSDIEEVRNQKTFPTEELRVTRELLEKEKMRNEEPQAFCVLPPKPSHEVFLREEQIRSILQEMEKLKNTKPNEITVLYLSGNPGCGKSEVAREIGEKVFNDVPDDEKEVKFVFTLNASSIDALVESYEEFAVSLNCDETSIAKSKEPSPEKKLIHLKSLVAPKLRKYSSWLLIVDNVTDLKSVFQYLPKPGEKTEGEGQILVTTQDSRSIADDPYTYHLSLSRSMNRDEAMKMLSVISGISRSADDEDLSRVVKALDLQPLALACAATYMKRVRKTKPTFSWQEYLEKLQQGKREATEGEYKNISIAYSKTMTAAVKMAIEKEMSEEPVMVHAFNFLSVMAPERIPLEFVVQYVTRSMPDEDENLVDANVASSSLILFFEESQDIGVHQVVYGCLNTALRPQRKEIEEFHFLLNVIQAFSTLLNSFDETSVNIIMATKSLVVHFVHISKKLRLTNLDVIREIPFGEEYSTRAKCLSSTGRICKIHGKYEEAECLFTICLRVRESIYGNNHPDLASTWNQLGGILGNLGRHEEANTCFKTALAIQEKAVDGDPVVLASTYNNYGINLQDRGLYREAKECVEKALALEERIFEPNHPALASTLNNLGNIFGELCKHEEAKSCYERALSIEIMFFGPHHQDVASTLSNLGDSLSELGQHIEAKDYLERAMAIEEMIFGPDHIRLASTLNNLGSIFDELEEHEKAKTCFERALTIEEKAYGSEHLESAPTLSNLGDTLGELGQHRESKAYFERALAIEENSQLGPNHPDVAKTLNNLGLCHIDLEERKEAKRCFDRALAIQQIALDPDHPDLASTLENLALVDTER